jgi:hypothetical protein
MCRRRRRQRALARSSRTRPLAAHPPFKRHRGKRLLQPIGAPDEGTRVFSQARQVVCRPRVLSKKSAPPAVAFLPALSSYPPMSGRSNPGPTPTKW